MGDNDSWGVASLGPRDLTGRIYVEIYNFSHYKSLGANYPQGVANLDHVGMVGRIYVGDHLTLLHTQSISSRPHGFREEDF